MNFFERIADCVRQVAHKGIFKLSLANLFLIVAFKYFQLLPEQGAVRALWPARLSVPQYFVTYCFVTVNLLYGFSRFFGRRRESE